MPKSLERIALPDELYRRKRLDYVTIQNAQFAVSSSDNFMEVTNSAATNQTAANSNTFGIVNMSKTRLQHGTEADHPRVFPECLICFQLVRRNGIGARPVPPFQRKQLLGSPIDHQPK
jgi:hypothetical protein